MFWFAFPAAVALEPRFDFGQAEAEAAADAEAGDLASLEPVDDRGGRVAEILGELAGGEKPLGHPAPQRGCLLRPGESAAPRPRHFFLKGQSSREFGSTMRFPTVFRGR